MIILFGRPFGENAMTLNRYNKTCIFLISLLFLSLFVGVSCQAKKGIIDLNDPEATKMVIAKIGDTPITLGELVEFGKSSPTFYGFLEIPGGPDKLLRELVLERLLLLEGKAQGIPEPANREKTLYLLRIKRELLPPLPPITEKEAKEYYKKHIEEFSTPLLLRLSQIKVYFNEKNRKKAIQKIKKAQEELKKGIPFWKVAEKFSEEPISRSRGGDIGFVPSTSLGSKEVTDEILRLKVGELSRILTIGNSFTIVRLIDRREPIIDPFDRVRELAMEKAKKAREKARLEDLRKRLESKWHVTYLN